MPSIPSGRNHQSAGGPQLSDQLRPVAEPRGAHLLLPIVTLVGLMAASGHPGKVLIGIGATKYTPLGATTFLQPGDQAIVRVYDTDSQAASELRQTVS